MLLGILLIFVNFINELWFVVFTGRSFKRLVMGILNVIIFGPIMVFAFYNGMRSIVINAAAQKYFWGA